MYSSLPVYLRRCGHQGEDGVDTGARAAHGDGPRSAREAATGATTAWTADLGQLAGRGQGLLETTRAAGARTRRVEERWRRDEGEEGRSRRGSGNEIVDCRVVGRRSWTAGF